MGNFSYIAENTCEPVRNPWHGDDICELQLVENGQVIEKMRGVYSGYGSVKHDKPFVHSVLYNGQWEDITNFTKKRMEKSGCSGDMWTTKDWGTIVDIHFDSQCDGIAAWHCDMSEKVPHATERSQDDPDQGDIFTDTDDWDEEE
jgi:hypothetical protein